LVELERSSQEFDPEIEEGILEASFDERLKRLNNAGGLAASESQPAPVSFEAML